MKGSTGTWPCEPLTGLNPFQEEIKQGAASLEFMAKSLGVTVQLAAYFSGFPEVTSDDVASISCYSTSVTFNLAVKESRFVHALAQFTGLDFEKRSAYDGQSISLGAKVPETHVLYKLGITQLSVAGYLPQTCKVVVKDYKELSEEDRKVYQELLDKGRPVYETVCKGEEVEEAEPEALSVG